LNSIAKRETGFLFFFWTKANDGSKRDIADLQL